MRLAACLAALVVAATSLHAAGTTLEVVTNPAGAKIYLQGYYKGLTPLTVTIKSPSPSGRSYRVTLVRSGYARWTGTVSLAAGQHKSLRATLKEVAAPPPATVRLSADLSGKVVCLDPGHPSETSAGTRGSKITEVEANWLVAQKLKSLLQGMGARVVLTKGAVGQKVTNRRRAEIANAAGAHLMVRLHCDSAGGGGLAVYYPDRQGTRYGVTGPSRQVIDASRRAAGAFYPVAVAALRGQIRGRGIHGDSGTYVGGKQGALTGSIFARVPVFTVEMVVLTQQHDDDFMASEQGRSAMARALAAGVIAVLGR